MRILILGASGVVGYHAAQGLKEHEVITVAKNYEGADYQLDLSKEKTLEWVIGTTKPEIVINAVKPPLSVDAMETERKQAYLLNTMLPEWLARLQKRKGFKLIHISTDGVYEGKEGDTYFEESLAYPKNYYTITKLLAEERIRCLADDFLILRTEGVFGYDRRKTNFFLRLKDAHDNDYAALAAADQFSQPICGIELARLISKLIEKDASGVFNAVSPDYISRFELAQRICNVMGWDTKLMASSIRDRILPVQAHLRVSISKLEITAGKVQTINEQLELLKRWNYEN
jgi:dTDP-4-dehydrorhamnose reductase